jgi:hypothetical protein
MEIADLLAQQHALIAILLVYGSSIEGQMSDIDSMTMSAPKSE